MPPKPPPAIFSKASILRRPPPSSRVSPTAQPRSQLRSQPNTHKEFASQYASSPPPGSPHNLDFSWLKLTASMCFFAGATVILIRDTLVSIDTVNGISMSPTLSPGVHERAEVEYVLLVPGSKVLRELQRGDIVTFWKPHQPEEISIKRIIALAGDTVYPRRGYATKLSSYTERHTRMNDGLPTDEDLAVLADKGEEVEVGKVVVPHGHVWVEGDNWRKTYDSNDFGPISVALINGRAERVFRNWWFRPIEDKREKKHRTRVIEGRSVVPEVYLE